MNAEQGTSTLSSQSRRQRQLRARRRQWMKTEAEYQEKLARTHKPTVAPQREVYWLPYPESKPPDRPTPKWYIDDKAKKLRQKQFMEGYVNPADCLRPRDYEIYMESDSWLRKREAAFRYWGKACRVCDTPFGLHVHHLSYDRLGAERMADLMVLCGTHHTKLHQYRDKHKYITLRQASCRWLNQACQQFNKNIQRSQRGK